MHQDGHIFTQIRECAITRFQQAGLVSQRIADVRVSAALVEERAFIQTVKARL